jgi:hypothetical protein
MDPAVLVPNPQNFRRHPEAQRNVLRVSMEQDGWLVPVIWNHRTGRIIDGHARVEEAIAQGLAAVPVIVLDVDEAAERRILVRFDRIGAMAEMDNDILAQLLNDVDIPLLDTGWDGAALPTGDLPDGLMPDREPNDVARGVTASLAFGDLKIPLTDEELSGLNARAQEYFEANGAYFGFASALLESGQ